MSVCGSKSNMWPGPGHYILLIVYVYNSNISGPRVNINHFYVTLNWFYSIENFNFKKYDEVIHLKSTTSKILSSIGNCKQVLNDLYNHKTTRTTSQVPSVISKR